ncbi:MAG TPA: peptidyl-prolyl cis-trans isomerase [Chthonomonadales bacterium]|nr:peptidyl-prolyl cis-trans isomerase [Chthonomonadales bacterium]
MNRTGWILCLAAAMPVLLAGCRDADRVVARVNREAITEEEFAERVRNVDAFSLSMSAQRPGWPSKAGEYAMRQVLLEKVLLQAAKARDVAPTDAQVTAYIQFARNHPELTSPAARNPFRNDADWQRYARSEVAVRNIAFKSITMTDADVKEVYDDPQIRLALTRPEQVRLTMFVANTEAKARTAAASLAQGVPLETIALQDSDDPLTRQRSGDIGLVALNALPREVQTALATMKPGDIARRPIRAELAPPGLDPGDGSAPTVSRWFLVRLVERIPSAPHPMEEVRPFLEGQVLQRKNPDFAQYVQSTVREFMQNATITVHLEEYEPVLQRLRDEMAQAEQAPGAPVAPAPPPTDAPAP